MTAQGMMQGMFVSAAPLLMIGLFLIVDPPFIMPLFNTALGLVVLLGIITLIIIGGLLMLKIVKIEV